MAIQPSPKSKSNTPTCARGKLVSLLALWLMHFISCQYKECNCEADAWLLMENDSIIHKLIDTPKTKITNYWNKFNEPSIHLSERESYRFSITVLLYDYFKVYRVEKDSSNYKLHVKEYAVPTTMRDRSDSLVSHRSRIISKSEWLSITDAFEENCFWTMATDIKSDDGYLDGSGWVLEGFKQNNHCTAAQYHLAFRTSPDSSNFRSICEKFMALDSLEVRIFE